MRAVEDWEGPGWLKFIRKRVKVWFVFGRQLFKYFRHKKLQEIFMKESVSDDREREEGSVTTDVFLSSMDKVCRCCYCGIFRTQLIITDECFSTHQMLKSVGVEALPRHCKTSF